jgi:hypothetical protein
MVGLQALTVAVDTKVAASTLGLQVQSPLLCHQKTGYQVPVGSLLSNPAGMHPLLPQVDLAAS